MNGKILVIEDDPGTLRLIRYTLEHQGYQVVTAPNGLEGLRKAQKEEPDLIILDVMLPGVDGFEVCYRLRTEPQTAQLPILMLSAKAQEIDKATALKVGADDYLTKPVDPSEITSLVDTLLTRKTVAKSMMVTFLGSKGGVGRTTMVVNVAIAVSQKGKRVTVVDLCPYHGSIAEHLEIKPEDSITHLLEKPIDTIGHRDLESASAVHQTGIRVLAIPQPFAQNKEISLPDANLLLERLREVTDYLLVDLPFQPPDLVKVALTKCDLVIIVTDSKADALPRVKSTATLLGLMGVPQERMGAVVIDLNGMFSDREHPKMKSAIELSTGVSLLGIIPYDTKACLELVPDSTPVILSNPNCPMAWSIRGVAQQIIAQEKERGQR